jgi:tetratricopeptide (TPR) repeat protein
MRLGDFLSRRGQAGDAEQALGHYQRSVEIAERLAAANPDSAQAARDVSVSLERLGDFLSSRGQAGDAEQALGHYQRRLEIAERLAAANPDSAQVAHDLKVSIERVAGMKSQQRDAAGALVEQERALGIARRLYENTKSYEMGRTLAISLVLTGQYAGAAGDQAQAQRHLLEAFTLLDTYVRQGTQLDAQMRQLHAQLASFFTSPASKP